MGLAAQHSTTCLAVDYGQRHRRELESAKSVAQYYGKQIEIVRLPVFPGSALANDAQHALGPCVVHGRNLALVSVALAFAANIGARCVLFGATADDRKDYPDCRTEFVEAMNVAALSSGLVSRLIAPFIDWKKSEVIRYGLWIGVPYRMTWTCYEGREEPCGICNACKLRRSAFDEAGAVDPL
jgi:7-cyano-7-deazaguanine synthase